MGYRLQMALFRGMGIEMKVEEDSKVRKTILCKFSLYT